MYRNPVYLSHGNRAEATASAAQGNNLNEAKTPASDEDEVDIAYSAFYGRHAPPTAENFRTTETDRPASDKDDYRATHAPPATIVRDNSGARARTAAVVLAVVALILAITAVGLAKNNV